MSEKSMRGKASKAGKGVGRKPQEPTTRVRVPDGCLHAVLELIETYRAGAVMSLKSVPEIKEQCVLNLVPEIRDNEPAILISVPEIKQDESLKSVPEIKEPIASDVNPYDYGFQPLTRKLFDRLPNRVKVDLKHMFGSPTRMLSMPMWVRGKEVMHIDEIDLRYSVGQLYRQ